MDRQIGQNLRRLRKTAGLSQTQLGEAIGVRFQQIQKYEAGANRITAARLKDIADALNVSVLALYGAVGERDLAKPVLLPPPDMSFEEAQAYLTALAELSEKHRANIVDIVAALHHPRA